MFNVDQRLKAIMEGTTVSSETGSSSLVFESDFSLTEASLDIQLMQEAAEAFLTESSEFTGKTSVDFLIEAANAANKNDLVKARGYLSMMAASIRDSLRTLVPSKAIRQLKLVNQHINNTLISLIPYVGPYIVLFKTIFKMKNLDPTDAKAVISEAETFAKNLEKGMRQATKDGNDKLAKKLEGEWREINNLLAAYKQTYKHVLARGVKSGV